MKTKKVTFQPYDRKELKFKEPAYPNKKSYVIRFKGNYTRDQIKKYVQQKSNELKKAKGGDNLISVTLRYGNMFKGATRTKAGEKVSLWDPSDSGEAEPGKITGFDIITMF